MANNNFIQADIEVDEDFSIGIKDSFTADISGKFNPADLIKAVQQKFEPKDVFDESDLEDWAESNGYVKENL